MYVLIIDGIVAKYPFTLEDVLAGMPAGAELPEDFTLDRLDGEGIHPVVPTERPEPGEGEMVEEGLPVPQGGQWVQTWLVRTELLVEPGKLYARVTDEGIVYPVTVDDLRRIMLDAGTSPPADGPIAQMDGQYGFVEVDEGAAPEPGPNQWLKIDGASEYEPGLYRKDYSLQDYTAEELTYLENQLLARIDAEAGEFRTRFITSVPGQAQTYVEKEREALAYQSDPEGSYPFLTAEAVATGSTVATVAALVAGTAAAWRQLGAAIEGRRMGAKQAVKSATTWAGKHEAAQVDWDGLLP